MRRGFMYWKPAQDALRRASRPYVGPNKNQKFEYQCAECKKWFKRKGVHIDHIKAAASLRCEADMVPFLRRLTEEDTYQFQVLCKAHNYAKAQADKKARDTLIDKQNT
jgi:DNA-directed RNA polymerase subunit RPC12/RpoP